MPQCGLHADQDDGGQRLRRPHGAARADYGIHSPGPVTVDLAAVQRRARDLVEPRRRALEVWLSGIEGCEIVRGHARFVGPRELAAGERCLRAHKVFLDVGSRASAPPWPGLDEVPWLSSTDMLSLKEVPRHLAVIGGGYVGLEFAQMYRRFGADVTLVEMGPALLRREDPVVANEIKAILEDEGIAVRTQTECICVAPHCDGVAVSVDCASGDREIVASHVLLALGRTPNTGDLGLDAAGIKTDDRGFIVVDDWLRTSAAPRLGARRLQRARRVHPHLLRRRRHGRRQPSGRREPIGP